MDKAAQLYFEQLNELEKKIPESYYLISLLDFKFLL